MSFPEPPHLSRQRIKNPKTIRLEDITMNTLISILTTSRGWIIRQALKYTGVGAASLSAWLASRAEALNIPTEQISSFVSPLQAAIVAGVTIGLELLFSFLARKNK